jgi:hypothetical protein
LTKSYLATEKKIAGVHKRLLRKRVNKNNAMTKAHSTFTLKN